VGRLDKARAIFEAEVKRRPRIRLTIRQRTQVLQQWPQLARLTLTIGDDVVELGFLQLHQAWARGRPSPTAAVIT
jgi:hypothetical protein